MKRYLSSAALVSILVAIACSDSPQLPRVKTCPAGQLLVEGVCVVPGANCTPDALSSIAADCATKNRACFQDSQGALCGVCLDGFVADGEACRARQSCADLSCEAKGRECFTNGNADASCGACVAGRVERGADCIAVSCDPSDVNGPAAACNEQKRVCVESADGPACGDCWNRFVSDAGACRPVQDCAELACKGANRLCTAAGSSSDAACGECRAGFLDDDGGVCVRRTGTTCDAAGSSSILAACQAEHRGCSVAADASADCGGCQAGFAEDPDSGGCVADVPCAQLGCEAMNRVCEQAPFGRCGACAAGFTEDPASGGCRPTRTCASLTCAEGKSCVEGGTGQDASCVPSCGPGTVRSGDVCAQCPACDATGEDGVWPELTETGYCICRTKPGYFYSVSGDVGTFPCDADGDGWLRESARIALGSKDPVISANAGCQVRQIDTFELVAEGGQSKDFRLPVSLAMFETDRNDDDQLLAAINAATGIQAYGRTIHAAELNRLTKMCHTRRADYNDNGVPDVEEWAGSDLAPTMRPEQRPFNAYSYFSELATGRFEPSGADPTHGKYVIAERSRDLAGADPLPIHYADGDAEYWRSCTVLRDAEFDQQSPPIGMDFADKQQAGDGWPGMNHHSQFKCVAMDDQPRPQVPSEMKPSEALDYLGRGVSLRLNRCGAVGEPATQEKNAAIPAFSCDTVPPVDAQAGNVFWAAVPYLDYDSFGKHPEVTDHAYLRGCVNECEGRLESCAGYLDNPKAVNCSYHKEDFGRFDTCQATELCDGLDNDSNGSVDDGNPGEDHDCANDGQPFGVDLAAVGHSVAGVQTCVTRSDCSVAGFLCQAGKCVAAGVCTPGKTKCRSGKLVCAPDVLPDSLVETCNVDGNSQPIDDDCDGSANESDPEDGKACDRQDLKGPCSQGKKACTVATGTMDCQQVVFPKTETCDGGGVDEDCDGKSNDLDTDSRPSPTLDPNTSVYSCPATYTVFYKDADKDGYGPVGVAPLCLCLSNAVDKYTASQARDCCDTDGNAHPGQLGWFYGPNVAPFAGPSACGTWDFDCDGSETKQYTTISPSGCKSGLCEDSGVVGWYETDTVANCGEQKEFTFGTCNPCSTGWGLRYQGCH